jgi:imidazolonepropionase-like amidohydrolase
MNRRRYCPLDDRRDYGRLDQAVRFVLERDRIEGIDTLKVAVFCGIGLGLLMLLCACSANPIASPSPMFTPQPVPAEALVITNGAVIDGTGAAPIQDGIVIVVKNKIAAVGRAADFSIPPGTKVIDAKGGAILPGIINAHVHETSSALVRQFYFLHRGVTSTCDMATPLTSMSQYKDDHWHGLSARGFRSGPVVNVPRGYPGTEELLYVVNSPEEARRAVSDIVNRGADYIKIALEPWNWKLPWATAQRDPIPNLDLPEVKAIVEQAHAHGKLVRAHVGTVEILDLALDGGVDVIEHVPLPRLEDIDFQSASQGRDYATLSGAYEAQLARMVKQHVVMVPTLDKIITWCESYGVTAERKALCVKYALSPVRRFHQLGGTLALGDDSGYMARTWMPIREMQRLVAAGLTPMQVLQASTQHAAQVCGHGAELGTLEPGKWADLIVVDGDLLNGIEVLSRVSVVIIDGQVAIPAK